MSEELLDEDWTGKRQLKEASKEKRLQNFLIDYFVIIVFVSLFYLLVESMGYAVTPTEDGLKERLQGMVFYLTYYLTAEGMTGGKTVGKMVTKTKVVTQDGEEPEVVDILARTFIRLVPFEPFSFWGAKPNGWHDRWSKTMVVEE